MKTITLINKAIVISTITLICCIASFAQFSKSGSKIAPVSSVGPEVRPFDFTDKYYAVNGIEAGRIINRRNGVDDLSVLDFSNDPNLSQVRILAVSTAYGFDGTPIFWNLYGEFYKDAFLGKPEGENARNIAAIFPMYVFPSAIVKDYRERQAAVINNVDGYFDKNTLGLAQVWMVKYTGAQNRDDQRYLSDLATRNGLSIDGTPIVRTTREIEQLTRRGLVTVTEPDSGRAPFAIAKIIQYPNEGGITKDAFLMHTTQLSGEPLPSEEFFLKIFTCMQSGGRDCSIR